MRVQATQVSATVWGRSGVVWVLFLQGVGIVVVPGVSCSKDARIITRCPHIARLRNLMNTDLAETHLLAGYCVEQDYQGEID